MFLPPIRSPLKEKKRKKRGRKEKVKEEPSIIS